MDYSKLGELVIPQVKKMISTILNPEVEPSTRKKNLEILFAELGSAVYNKIFDMNAFDMDIPDATSSQKNVSDEMYSGMAKRMSDSVSQISPSVMDNFIYTMTKAYVNATVAKAQRDAMEIATASNKKPEIKREMVSETCKWCASKVTHGWIEDPDSSMFQRHRDCDCRILTRGYKSRNGLLDNYVKPKDRAGGQVRSGASTQPKPAKKAFVRHYGFHEFNNFKKDINPEMSEKDVEALKSYKKSWKGINGMYEKNKIRKNSAAERIKNMFDRAGGLKENTQLFRVMHIDKSNIDALPEVGGEFEERAFTSTSLIESTAWNFTQYMNSDFNVHDDWSDDRGGTVMFEIDAPKGTKALAIDDLPGQDKEMEVLLDKPKYKVKSIEMKRLGYKNWARTDPLVKVIKVEVI